MPVQNPSPSFTGRMSLCLLVLVLAVIVAVAPGAGSAQAAGANLVWDPNTESDLAGYRLHYGTSSQNYTVNVDVGNQTTYPVENLDEGITYYFSLTAYDLSGNESGYSEELVYTVPGFPEMTVAGSGEIADGDTTPSLSDGTDFGAASVGGGSVMKVFAIGNTGSATLNLTGNPAVSIGGTNPGDFTVVNQPASTVDPGGETTFQISFAPGAEGTRTAVVNIPNDDADENPYDFAVSGTGGTLPLPEINLAGNGQSIADGDSTPDLADNTHFGDVQISGDPVSRIFTIQNTGDSDLVLSGIPKVAIGGAHAPHFEVVAQPSSPLSPGTSSSFEVIFSPVWEGEYSAELSIISNDGDESPYNFSIGGTGSAAVETVTAPSVPVGPVDGYTVTYYLFSTGESSSSQGDAVQYMFDWGDGTDSGWLPEGTTEAGNKWSLAGTYAVRAKARCVEHTDIESPWSGNLSVTIIKDTLPPAIPRGLRLGQR